MTLLNPIFLWTLLGLIPLAAIYFLKVRPRRKPTTAYFLWELVLEEKQSTSLMRRLRDIWSLLLMLIAFSAVALALTRPRLIDTQYSDTLILVDCSASMNARDGRTTRLARAKQVAAQIATALGGERRAAVASVGDHLTFQTHLTDNPRAVLDAIDRIRPTNERFESSLFDAAESQQLGDKDDRVILISDGCCGGGTVPENVELFKVGRKAGAPESNIGVVAADMRYLPSADRRVGIYVQIASTHKEPTQVDLLVCRISQDEGKDVENLRKLLPLTIEPGLNAPQQWTLDDAEPGRWILKLEIDDALATDNIAYLALDPPRPIRVAVDSKDRFFFENSVLAFARGNGLLTLTEEDPTIVLVKSTSASTSKPLDAPRSLIFQPLGESPWWSEVAETLDVVAPRVLVDDHPALRYIDVTSIPFIGARRLSAPKDAQVWVASEQNVPLIYRVDHNGSTAVIVNMDPVAAEFYYSAWFPILVHSTSVYLAGREEQRMASYRPGSRVLIPGARSADSTIVVDPSGARSTVHGQRLPPLKELGFYQLTNDSGEWLVGCSLLADKETLLDNEQVPDTSTPIRRGRPLSAWLLIAAILLVTTESLLYHRRKVG